MSEIAEAVGISRALLYKEFGDKPGLGEAVVLREAARFIEGIEGVLAHHDADPSVRLHARTLWRDLLAGLHPAAPPLNERLRLLEGQDDGELLEWIARSGAEPALRRAALARVGLSERADLPASVLSHGEHRQVELAMALAGAPRMLLLDEPMAGLGPEESARMVEMLRALKKELTILLVEHDMEAVFALADRITVLVYGRVIASGAPPDIRGNAAVREAYLGEIAAEDTRHG